MALRVEIYSRPDCHLCEAAERELADAAETWPLDIRIVNIESSREMETLYGHRVPVVFIEGREAFEYRVNAVELERRLIELCRP